MCLLQVFALAQQLALMVKDNYSIDQLQKVIETASVLVKPSKNIQQALSTELGSPAASFPGPQAEVINRLSGMYAELDESQIGTDEVT